MPEDCPSVGCRFHDYVASLGHWQTLDNTLFQVPIHQLFIDLPAYRPILLASLSGEGRFLVSPCAPNLSQVAHLWFHLFPVDIISLFLGTWSPANLPPPSASQAFWVYPSLQWTCQRCFVHKFYNHWDWIFKLLGLNFSETNNKPETSIPNIYRVFSWVWSNGTFSTSLVVQRFLSVEEDVWVLHSGLWCPRRPWNGSPSKTGRWLSSPLLTVVSRPRHRLLNPSF